MDEVRDHFWIPHKGPWYFLNFTGCLEAQCFVGRAPPSRELKDNLITQEGAGETAATQISNP